MKQYTCDCSKDGACPGNCKNIVDDHWFASEHCEQALVAGAAILGALVLIGLVVVVG